MAVARALSLSNSRPTFLFLRALASRTCDEGCGGVLVSGGGDGGSGGVSVSVVVAVGVVVVVCAFGCGGGGGSGSGGV